MKTYLETERLRLREFTLEDKKQITLLDSDPDVVRHISNGVPSSKKEIDRAMKIFLTYSKKYQHKFGYWVAIEKKSSQFIGWFHMRPLKSEPDNLMKQELGYRLLKEFWGKGYATEGTRALIQKAFHEYNVKEVFAHAMKTNTTSQKVMLKCGLKFLREEIYEEYPGPDKQCVW